MSEDRVLQAVLRVQDLRLFKQGRPLLGPLAFAVPGGEVMTLMGASGVGKSTVLNWLIGALDPAFSAQGEAWLGTLRIDVLPTQARRMGILFQDDLLFPHMSVGENLMFALAVRFAGRKVRHAAVVDALAEVGLAGFFERDVSTLSGGQRARASLLRTLLAEPLAILLDEPFSRLDASLRQQFRAFVFERIAASGIPAVLVTHDPDDVPPGGQVLLLQAEEVDHAG